MGVGVTGLLGCAWVVMDGGAKVGGSLEVVGGCGWLVFLILQLYRRPWPLGGRVSKA